MARDEQHLDASLPGPFLLLLPSPSLILLNAASNVFKQFVSEKCCLEVFSKSPLTPMEG